METQNPYNRNDQYTKPVQQNDNKFNGRAFAGLIVVIVGSALLVRALGVPMPRWLFSWPMFLIVLGFFVGVKHSFKGIGWIILLVIGGFFLFEKVFFDLDLHRIFWPIFIIGIGLYMILKPKKKEGVFWGGDVTSDENFIEATAIFGGIKKHVIAKDFKGGDVTSIFGGSEIILSQADINGTVVLDVSSIFGGSKIIVPTNWVVKTQDVTAILGGVDDKRTLVSNAQLDPNKVLVIKGIAMFGGIEIKSF
jgi:predicted membrane protein